MPRSTDALTYLMEWPFFSRPTWAARAIVRLEATTVVLGDTRRPASAMPAQRCVATPMRSLMTCFVCPSVLATA
eukprot:1730493-Pyramimonas_sp.AAC.1